jgi:hypothetical protein
MNSFTSARFRNKATFTKVFFGNPAFHSVHSEMFFSFESNGREHRFWKVLKKAGNAKNEYFTMTEVV